MAAPVLRFPGVLISQADDLLGASYLPAYRDEPHNNPHCRLCDTRGAAHIRSSRRTEDVPRLCACTAADTT